MRNILVLVFTILFAQSAAAQTAAAVLDVLFEAARGYTTYRGIKAILQDNDPKPAPAPVAAPAAPAALPSSPSEAVTSARPSRSTPRHAPMPVFASKALENATDTRLRKLPVKVSGVNALDKTFLDFKKTQSDETRKCLRDVQTALSETVANDPNFSDFVNENKVEEIKIQFVDNSSGLLPSTQFQRDLRIDTDRVVVATRRETVYDDEDRQIPASWKLVEHVSGRWYNCYMTNRFCGSRPSYSIYERKITRARKSLTIPVQLAFGADDRLRCEMPAVLESTSTARRVVIPEVRASADSAESGSL
ncbi:MAG TPA: hypothetical protein VFV50_03285 [Bdellovibrionales bacterium]|nr:hypothetical protein [Bdellovibrionales bacterium]